MGRKSKEQERRDRKTTYKTAWNKESQRRFNIAFNMDKDADLIRFLESVPNKSDYIRKLVLADMEKEQEHEQD